MNEKPQTEALANLMTDGAMRGRAENRQAFYALRKLQASFGHFVPRDFLEFLGAKDISDVVPGDEVEMTLTVMFSDIRNFTTLSEDMSSHQTFQFINSYLANMEVPIHRHGGIIDKFIGDAIMALFTGSADSALDAAISMMSALKQYNANRRKAHWQDIEIGIGLNTGLATLGVFGHSERMETTVIGDCVNVSSRMEGLTKKYLSPILISEDTLIALNDPSKYCIRFVDRVRVKGRIRPLSVYEVFDGDDGKLIDRKLLGLEVFERAVALFHLREVDAATQIFENYLVAIPDDKIAVQYLDRCHEFRENGIYDGIGELNRNLDWSDSFNTGNEKIDGEHRKLLENINLLSTALHAEDMGQIKSVLAFLAKYAKEHFATEYDLMVKYDYPLMDSHMVDHARFVKRMGELTEELTSGQQDKRYSLFRVNLFLYDWLISHSTRIDRHLAAFVAEKERAAHA